MKIVVDACTIINLINGQVLSKVSQLRIFTLCIVDTLLEEELLNEPQKIFIETLLAESKIQLLESNITVPEFLAVQSKYKIGAGETECICVCKKYNHIIATDDLKARNSAIKELGGSNVIGSLYLLRETVRTGSLTCSDAILAYKRMKKEGGFLPKVDQTYLCQ